MQKIETIAINRTNSSKVVATIDLKKSGISRDILTLRKNDKIVIPKELEVRMDTFTPKGSDKTAEFYTIVVDINSTTYDASMASFRRTRAVVDEELDDILTNQIVRTLHQLGDDEQRAEYLRGKTLIVDEVRICKDRFREGQTVRVPMWRLV